MRRRQSGTVFILTLGVLAVLVAVVAEVALSAHASVRAQTNRLEQQRASILVQAAIQRAVAELGQQSLSRAALSDAWAGLGNSGGTRFLLSGGGFRVQILDACARLNLNTAGQQQLKALNLDDTQVDSLQDWREPSTTPRPLGAKDSYYNALSDPYNAKLKSFDSVDELLQVRGFTPDSLYSSTKGLAELLTVESSSADKNPTGGAKLDINSASADQLIGVGVPRQVASGVIAARRKSFDTMQQVIQLPQMTSDGARALADNTSIGATTQKGGLVNINTATEPVLEALGLDASAATAITGRQSSPFNSIGELLDVPGVDVPTLAKVIDSVCVSSRSFLVRAVGEAGNARIALEASLTLADNGTVQVTRMQPQHYWAVRGIWNWPDQPTDEISLSSVQ